MLAAEVAAANMRGKAAQEKRTNALAEKARLEAQIMREQQDRAQDPALRNEFAANSAGLTTALGQQVNDLVSGRDFMKASPLQPQVDEEGNAYPPAVRTTLPDGVSPAQRDAYQQAIAAHIAQSIATGKTNAQQLMQGVQVGQETGMRRRISDPQEGLIPDEQNLLSAGITGKTVEPFSQTGGIVLNRQTGDTTDAEGEIATAIRQRINAQAGASNAAAGASRARERYTNERSRGPATGQRPLTAGQDISLRERLGRAAEKAWRETLTKEEKKRWGMTDKTNEGAARERFKRSQIESGMRGPAGEAEPASATAPKRIRFDAQGNIVE